MNKKDKSINLYNNFITAESTASWRNLETNKMQPPLKSIVDSVDCIKLDFYILKLGITTRCC